MLAMHLTHVQNMVGSQYMSTVILMYIFFLSYLIYFQGSGPHIYCSSPICAFQGQLAEPDDIYIGFPFLPQFSASWEWHCRASSRLNQDLDSLAPSFLLFLPSNHRGVLLSKSAFTHRGQDTIISCLVYPSSLLTTLHISAASQLNPHSKAATANFLKSVKQHFNFQLKCFSLLRTLLVLQNNFCTP